MTLILAQNLGEYGSLAAGGASAFERFLNTADRLVRTPETAIPIGLIVLVAAVFLLRRR